MTDKQLEAIAASAARRICEKFRRSGIDFDSVYSFALMGAHRGRARWQPDRRKRQDHYVWLCAFHYAWNRTVWPKTKKLNRAVLVEQHRPAPASRWAALPLKPTLPDLTAERIAQVFEMPLELAQIVYLRYVKRLKQKAVAELLNLPLSTLRGRNDAARQYIQRLDYGYAKERLQCA